MLLSISCILLGNGNPLRFADVEVMGLFNPEIMSIQNLFLGILTAIELFENKVDQISQNWDLFRDAVLSEAQMMNYRYQNYL